MYGAASHTRANAERELTNSCLKDVIVPEGQRLVEWTLFLVYFNAFFCNNIGNPSHGRAIEM